MLSTPFTCTNLIAGVPSALGQDRAASKNAATGEDLPITYIAATTEEVLKAGNAAVASHAKYSTTPPEVRAKFLDQIASALEVIKDDLIECAGLETGLPPARLTGEIGRTCGQLRLFASLLREGSWVGARLDLGDPGRTPLPKPDIRRMLVPLGPVAVFGASNFPFAFSVAGGDTASALAAGCPVVVKAHPSHPGTSDLAARAILAAAQELGLPPGVFNMLHGGAEVGQVLVRHPDIAAVAFTGSQKAGRALFDLAAARERPIPVYAEMGSVNPLFVLPGAVEERSESLAKGYAESLTLGVGQFCTNPGILVGEASEAFDRFVQQIGSALQQVSPGTMLNKGIRDRYCSGVDAWSNHRSLKEVCNVAGGGPALFSVSGEDFLSDVSLREELFGPAAIVVRCDSQTQVRRVAEALTGQLTVTVHYGSTEVDVVRDLLPTLTRTAGRVLANGFPTGVEVCHSMQHGGPYPATTDARSTSVGTAAIERFVRPVAYQNIPDDLLPPELQDANPQGIWRLVNGEWTKAVASRTNP